MDILIISMPGATARRRFQTEQMARLQLPFRFLDAFDAARLSETDCQRAADSWPSPTLRQDVACFHAHRLAWEAVITSGRQTLILEDDAVLSEDCREILRLIAARDEDWNVAYDLEFVPERHLLATSTRWQSEMAVARRIFQNRLGLASYVIGPEIARRMREDTQTYGLVDAVFWSRPWLRSYQIEPAPAIQLRFLNEAPQHAAFSRPAADSLFRPSSKPRKHLMRLKLELTKARNSLTGLMRSERRMIKIDRSRFAPIPDGLSGPPVT